ncbi:autotransporter outer membrane beta-barrel domain-containing protein [Pontiella desulfatans]|nr:hypothetical protein [Pontiella desulfatans]
MMKKTLGIMIAAGTLASMATALPVELTWSTVAPEDVEFFEDYLNTVPGAGGTTHSAASVGMEIWAGNGTDLSSPTNLPINLSNDPGLNNQVAARSANSKPSVLLHNNTNVIARVDDIFLFSGWGPYGEANSFLVQVGTTWYISDALPAGEYGSTAGGDSYNNPGMLMGYSTHDTVWHVFHEGDFDSAGFSNMIPSAVGTALPNGDIVNTGMLQNGANSSYIKTYAITAYTPPGDAYYVAATPTDWTDSTAWSDGFAANGGTVYYATNSVVLETPAATSTFPGISLSLYAPQRMEIMASGAEVITVPELKMYGADLGAGIIDAAEARIDGAILVQTDSTFSGAMDESRDIRVLARIVSDADITLSAPSRTIYIDNPTNEFTGTWIVSGGAAEFASVGSIGGSTVFDVQSGTLRIQDNWKASGSVTVADSPDALVDLGNYDWALSSLVIGSSNVIDGAVYTVAELNAIGANPVFSGTGTVLIGALPPPPPEDLLVGLDTWSGTTAPAVPFTATDISATATASGGWSITDGSGRGSSKDGTWGTFDGNGHSASSNTTAGVDNYTLTNGKTDGEITISFTNNTGAAIDLGALHFDAVAFRPNAARTYAVNVLAGSDITVGTVFTSAAGAITSLGGNLLTDDLDPLTHDQHDDIDVGLNGLEDHTLEAGEMAIIQLAFSGGTGSGSGHHLFVDNVGISSAAASGPPSAPVMTVETSGSDMMVSWASSASFQLQTRPNMAVGEWMNVPGGTTSPVTVPMTNDVEFLRLVWP